MCLVVFGSRAVESELGSGRFYCPQCNDDRPYWSKEARRWFTLFFIPVIPLNRLGSYIECPVCKTAYTGEVLNVVPSTSRQKALRATVNDAVKRLLVGLVCVHGQVDPKKVAYAVELGRSVLGDTYNQGWFSQDVSRFRGQDLLAPMRTVGSGTDEQGRELLLRLAILLSASDGEIDKAESELINGIAEALGVPESRVPVITQEALQQGLATRQELA